MSQQERVARFGELLARLDDEIAWDVCAGVYCDGDASGSSTASGARPCSTRA